MPKPLHLLLPVCVLAALAFPAGAGAGHTTDPRTPNLVPLGHIAEEDTATISDLAFWGNLAFEGSYDGFRIIDVSNPMAPTVVNDYTCGQSQGDLTIYRNILVRSQDTAEVLPGNDIRQACHPGLPGFTGAERVAMGWEGIQIFDVSNPASPQFVTAVATDCGSHTHTQYLDRANNRLIIYVSRSGGGAGVTTPYGTTCREFTPKITAVEIPLNNPAAARVVNNDIAAGNNGCHDVAVHQGVRRLYGACRPYMILWDITDPVNPVQLHAVTHPAVSLPTSTGGWHTASLSWNGRVLISGWEPGGGSNPRCTALDPPTEKTIYFWNAADGALLGTWTLPRDQALNENCTIHNLNVVPFLNRHILVHGSYRSGTSVVDFTSPSAPREIAWTDPPAPASPPTCGQKNPAPGGPSCVLGGAWSTYWYNDVMYESDILEGLNLWDLNEPWWERGVNLARLNPQTQEDVLSCRVRATGSLRARQRASLAVSVRVVGQAVLPGQGAVAVRVRLRGAGVSRSAMTRQGGVAHVRVRPTRRGTLRINVPSTLNMTGCSTRRGVRAARVAAAPAVTGRVT